MSKARRVSQAAMMAAKRNELARLREEASTVAESLRFYLDCIGNREPLSLDYTSESLVSLERIFFDLSRKKELPADLPFDMFARLVGIYLGEVTVRERSGQWAVYDGGEHTFNQLVLQIEDSHIDPLLFAALLPNAKIAPGLKDGKALYTFATSADSLGVFYARRVPGLGADGRKAAEKTSGSQDSC